MQTTPEYQASRNNPVLEELSDIPNLIEIQMNSYRWFLEEGLRELFRNFSPIEDFTGTLALDLVDYYLEEPKYSQEECRQRDMTYEAPMKVKVRLRGPGREVLEQEVYLGALPLMTERGTFIINGAERVVVSQLARSPGVYFDDTIDLSGRILYSARIIPAEGMWTEVETEPNDVLTVRLGQSKKFPVTTLIRALNFLPRSRPEYKAPVAQLVRRKLLEPLIDQRTGEVLLDEGAVVTPELFEEKIRPLLNEPGALPEEGVLSYLPATTDREILDLFSTKTLLKPAEGEDFLTREVLQGRRPAQEVKDLTGRVLCPAYQKIDVATARRIEALHLTELEVLEVPRYIDATLDADPVKGNDEQEVQKAALLDLYRKIRPGDPATYESATQLIQSVYYDLRRYDLARVGRYKINKKLGQSIPIDDHRGVTREDLINILFYILALAMGKEGYQTDDIDHLENKRVRSVGELLQNQLRLGFLRMEKVAKERMTALDPDKASPGIVLSIKPITASIKSFFGSSQLCQFMDQHNPLAELTHKRRLSALGPGGLSRQSAKLEVRDVHHSHYGRICPIETPEGPNIGLIGSMAIFTRVDSFGFLLAPYRRVVNGKVIPETVYLTADQEDNARIAPASTPVDKEGRIIPEFVQVRYQSKFPVVRREQVDYIDRSPMQIFSAAASLIPFLENDDANRALMGSNMQRQSVPLIHPEAPIVATGVEEKVARDSGAVIVARRDGRVVKVTSEEIVIRTREGEEDRYPLQALARSNQNTCIRERPLVRKGQRVKAGEIIADGPCTDHGELSLGRNILVAYLPWEGYNYEDAIIISRRIVRDDVYTSIHIEKYEAEARDTKLGPEEITRDIPNVGEEALKDLDEDGIVRIGAEVQPEDILVGRVTPKSQGEQTPEERLITAIFGKKAEDTHDNSLRMPHGGKGKVVDVKKFSRFKYECPHCKIEKKFSKKPDKAICDRCQGEMKKLEGDELPAGVNMLVRVYVAQKRRIMEGDKMAGRHGNKGVISRVMPEEEMPFLPDGTPVDIILNPLGVPSRMNIGQILEAHLGYVGKVLGIRFIEPIFRGKKEPEVLQELERLAEHFRRERLREYIRDELGWDLQLLANGKPPEEMSSSEWAEALRTYISQLSQEERDQLAEYLGLGVEQEVLPPVEQKEEGVIFHLVDQPAGEPQVRSVTPEELVQRIQENVYRRIGLNPKTGKCRLINGKTGEPYDQEVTCGYIYMMKLLHLVEDKIHARSTGPYALVTQQPLGGKAQFGGQRFGEMEVWALEAYGAAYTLQEILTIKSDDVQGRVKTYEAIVKGDQILEPGIPESFKILVAELQNLGLKVTVEDETDRVIPLSALEEEEPTGNGGRSSRSARAVSTGAREE